MKIVRNGLLRQRIRCFGDSIPEASSKNIFLRSSLVEYVYKNILNFSCHILGAVSVARARLDYKRFQEDLDGILMNIKNR